MQGEKYMLKQILSLMLAITTTFSTVSLTFADDITPSEPVNVSVPAAATTYSSISIIWDKPDDYKEIEGYKIYRRNLDRCYGSR